MEQEEFHPVYLKEKPDKILLRLFNDEEDYESQVMRESEIFFEKYGIYPNGILLNYETFNRWYNIVAESANRNAKDDISDDESIPTDDIENEQNNYICEFKESFIPGGTSFATPKYEMLIIYNSNYQDKVYQLFYTDTFLKNEEEVFYPVINMIKTGKQIKLLAELNNISVNKIQEFCGLSSFQAVYKWFNGKAIPTVDNLGVLANLFNVSIDDLLIFDKRELEKDI